MAIALTAHGSQTPASAASITQSAVVSVSGSTIVVAVTGYDSTTQSHTNVTGVTYGGVAMTQVDGIVASGGGGGASNYSFILQNATAGTANIVVSFVASITAPAMAYAVFSGAATSGGADAHNFVNDTATSTATPGNLSVTTVANNAVVWGWGGFNNNSGGTVAGVNQTQLDQFAGSYGVQGYLTTARTPAGSVILSYTNGSTDMVSIFLVSIAPAGGVVILTGTSLLLGVGN